MNSYSQTPNVCHQRITAISIGGFVYVSDALTVVKNIRCVNLKSCATISYDSFRAIEEKVIAD